MSFAAPTGFLNEPSPIRRRISSPMWMNILATSPNPQTCARNLDDWTLETQIVTVSVFLSRYAKDCSFQYNDLWKKVAKNHPFMRWLFNDEKNIDWLKEYGILLQCEYSQRTGNRHAGSAEIFNFIEDFRPPIGLEPWAFMNR